MTKTNRAVLRSYLSRPYRAARRAYYVASAIPRYRDVQLECGVTVNADMRHRNWRQVYKKRHHEVDTERFISGFLRPGDTVFDVGAQIGMFTAVAAQLIGPEGRIFAFEPDKTNHAELQRTIARHKLANVTVTNAGLSDTVGQTTFYRPDGAWGSFMAGAGQEPTVTEGFFSTSKIGSFTIQTHTIDSFVQERRIQRLDLLKIDVDGPEVTILRGAPETLRSLQPAVLVEASMFYAEHGSSIQDLFDVLQGAGYEMYGAIRNGESAQRMRSPADVPLDLGKKGAAMNFFCHVPGRYEDRWSKLWFMGQG